MDFNHIPVILQPTIEGLEIKPEGIYVDGTTGGAGHSYEIAKRLSSGQLICIDQDEEALYKAKERLAEFGDRVRFIRSNFSNLDGILDELQIDTIDGMLLDIGVSSYQFDESERGFSYRFDSPLDMRMDQSQQKTAYDVINTYSQEELERIFWTYGEEKWGKRIAQFILEQRVAEPIETTFQLVECIKKAIPRGAREEGGHPAKRTFQAIRIEVNRELDVLSQVIPIIVDRLNPGGRVCIITFHSLEDRIVKNAFREFAKGCVCPSDFPICVCDRVKKLKIITTKPIVATDDEIIENPRSKSAKLRIAEKL